MQHKTVIDHDDPRELFDIDADAEYRVGRIHVFSWAADDTNRRLRTNGSLRRRIGSRIGSCLVALGNAMMEVSQ